VLNEGGIAMRYQLALIAVLAAILGVSGCSTLRHSKEERSSDVLDPPQSTPLVGQKGYCEAIPIGPESILILGCGGGAPSPPDEPDKPVKEPPDKPDKPVKPDRSQYIAVNEYYTKEAIEATLKSPISAESKRRAIEEMQKRHQDCVAGRAKCIGEP
jgi:hypothetical protein